MSRFLKSYWSVVLIPWAIIAIFILLSPVISYLDRSKPLHFDPPADFEVVLSRNLAPTFEIFYQGDNRVIRLTTKRSPKAVISILEKELDLPSEVVGMAKNEIVRIARSDDEMINRNKAVDSVTWPSIPHGPTGDCHFVRYGGMTYSKFFIWPDGNEGTVLEVIEGFED